MAHEITVATKDPHLSRGECQCGWRGVWHTKPELVARSVTMHLTGRALPVIFADPR